MHRILSVANVMGLIVVLFGGTLVLPIAVSWWLGDGAIAAYDEAFAIAVAGGGALWWLTRRFRRELAPRDGFVLVIAIWIGLPALAALPLWFQIPGLSFTDAYFEAASGFSATGATVLSGLEHLPPSINLWRTELHWIGGLGIIVLAVAILPLLGVGGRQLYRAEIPGPMKDTRLTPRVTETAKGFWVIYVVLTAACWTAYYLAGMGALDALIHAFSTLALGGFSSYDASLGHFDSPLIEAIAIVFMMLAALSYATHFLAWRRRSLLAYWRDPEAFIFVGVLLASMVGIAAFLWLHEVYGSFWTALRYAAFNTASVATTLGFSTTDYGQWPVFAPIWMLFLCTFMTCSASTGGGIKLIRARLMLQQIVREMTQLVHPRAEVPLRVGGSVVPNKIIFAVLGFMALYGSTTLLVVFLLTATGLDFLTAVSAAVACINNTGPGLGAVGPATTYAGLSDFQTWVCSAAMLLGRLELFTLLVVFSPHFWRH
jgi:trk system potassium uptake protein TrkH